MLQTLPCRALRLLRARQRTASAEALPHGAPDDAGPACQRAELLLRPDLLFTWALLKSKATPWAAPLVADAAGSWFELVAYCKSLDGADMSFFEQDVRSSSELAQPVATRPFKTVDVPGCLKLQVGQAHLISRSAWQCDVVDSLASTLWCCVGTDCVAWLMRAVVALLRGKADAHKQQCHVWLAQLDQGLTVCAAELAVCLASSA